MACRDTSDGCTSRHRKHWTASAGGDNDGAMNPATAWPPPWRAIVFDLDGTLIDSAGDLAAALNRMLAESGRGQVTVAQFKRMIGDGSAKLVERGFAATGAIPDGATLQGKLARFLEIYEAASAVLTRPYQGVPETLGVLRARGLRLGVCTNKPDAATRRVLDDLGLAGQFDAIAGGDTFAVRKPDPGHLKGLLDQLAVPPSAAIMVGDNEHDAAAARSAGLPMILVSYGYARSPVAEIRPDAVIDRFDDLPAALDQLRPAS